MQQGHLHPDINAFAKQFSSLLVGDLAAVHLLDKQICLAHVVPPHIHLAIGHSNVYTLHSPHQVIHQAFAIPADNVDQGVGWRCAVVNCNLQAQHSIHYMYCLYP